MRLYEPSILINNKFADLKEIKYSGFQKQIHRIKSTSNMIKQPLDLDFGGSLGIRGTKLV